MENERYEKDDCLYGFGDGDGNKRMPEFCSR